MGTHNARAQERASQASAMAFTVGGVGVLVAVALLFGNGSQSFFQSYLTAFILPAGMALG